MKILLDSAKTAGKIKPMHAVNNPPTVPVDHYGLYPKYTEAKIPYARLHDTGGAYGGSRYVDIPNVFPDFNADENDPASYDFAFTDVVLKNLLDAGVRPYYRLGVTIENYRGIKPYNIYPPADPAKWARICEHIIRHYNEGWANGFRWNIEYWEIWNEPDNEPVPAESPMWQGTMEEYFELYKVTSRHLKQCFPDIKVGGYASCGFYALNQVDVSVVAHSTPRTEYFIEFFEKFLAYAKENALPMDFFSWHSYAHLKNNVFYADYARRKLTESGYGSAEIHFNEWNPGIRNRGKAVDAANIAAMMIAMHGTSTDMCMYYDGQMHSSYCGLFDSVNHTVFKAYYAFLYFGKLYSLGTEIKPELNDLPEGLFVLAAADGKENAVLLANTTGKEQEITVEGPGSLKVYATDEEHENMEIPLSGSTFTMPEDSVWLCVSGT